MVRLIINVFLQKPKVKAEANNTFDPEADATFDPDFNLSAACLPSIGCLKGRNSIPPMYARSTFGTSTPPSFWQFSRIQQSVLSVAVKVEFSI